MRDLKRIDKFMNILTGLWKTFPDWRFGQMIENFFRFVRSETGIEDIYYVEDDKMLELLNDYFDYDETLINYFGKNNSTED